MKTADEEDLAQLGREVATHVIGAGKIDRVAVEVRRDAADEPAYYFALEMTSDSERPYRAKDRVRLGLEITKALIERGDETFPHVEMMTPEDWQHRYGA